MEMGEKERGMGGEGITGSLRKKVEEIKRWQERKERELRRNVIIKGMEVKNGRLEEAVKEVMRKIGVEAKVEETRSIGGTKDKRGEMVLVKMKDEDEKSEVMSKKGKLKRRRERIEEDYTWRERRMKWRLQEIARREEKKGKRAWVGYGKIRIDGEWWRWYEEEEVLRD